MVTMLKPRFARTPQPATPTLILNADDLGRSAATNAVLDAPISHGGPVGGLVGERLSFSLLTTAPGAEDAAARARAMTKRACIGLHLALTEFAAAEPAVWPKGLLDNGRMPADFATVFRALTDGTLSPKTVEAEWLAQLARFDAQPLALGTPTHLDTHMHVHLFPTLWPVLARVAEKAGGTGPTPWVRAPREPWRFAAQGVLRKNRGPADTAATQALGTGFAAFARLHRLRYPAYTFGLSLGPTSALSDLVAMAQYAAGLGPGTVAELYLHPSSADEIPGYAQLRLLEALKSAPTWAALTNVGVTLGRFRDL
jgi:predicted glycoside hydrolase/deacetylase ChbG (UPF0249 family)